MRSSASISSSIRRQSGSTTPRRARRDRSGSTSMAASAEPNLLMSWRKVTGPTFSVRIRRSQATLGGGQQRGGPVAPRRHSR
jgi:hypothetical protein